MANKTNIFSDIWCDLLFETRNKDYGAYVLRQDSSKRHFVSLVLTVVFFSFVMILPAIMKAVIPKRVDRVVEVTTLADIKSELDKPKPEEKIEEPPPPLKTTMKVTELVIEKDELIREDEEIKIQEEIIQSNVAISVKDVIGTDDPNAVDIADLNQGIVDDENAAPLIFVEQMPEFPGGNEACLAYLSKNIQYPQEALENDMQGMVVVQFTVNKDGHLVDIAILKGIGGGCEEEAIRVIKSMPKWIPGKQNGNTVRVRFTLPVRFVLQ